jgi:hypothetical protein
MKKWRKKMNEIIEYIAKLDYLEIINNALNRQQWGQKYLLLIQENCKIKIRLVNFDFVENNANFLITCEHDKKGIWEYPYQQTIHYNLQHFEPRHFLKMLENRINSLIINAMENDIKILAKEKIKTEITEYNTSDIGDDELRETGLLEDMEALRELNVNTNSSEDDLREEAAEILNAPFESKKSELIKYYKETGEDLDSGLFTLYKKLKEEENGNKRIQ